MLVLGGCGGGGSSSDEEKAQQTAALSAESLSVAGGPINCSVSDPCATDGNCDDPAAAGIDIIYGQESGVNQTGCTTQPQLTECQCENTDKLCKLKERAENQENNKWYCS